MQSPTDKHVPRPGKSGFPLALMLAASLLVTAPVRAAALPDTGQSQCDNGANVLAACSIANSGDAATYPRQDGRFGRDAQATAGALAKTGAGAAGFDYTKIANNGTALGAGAALGSGATDWGCTRDNVTGLTWEMKNTNSGTLHDWSATFSWYSTDNNSNGNGGVPGPGSGTQIPTNEGGNTCHFQGTLVTNCNTQEFIAAINTPPGLCGNVDWRLPTQRELLTLVHAGAAITDPNIDLTYFPNTVSEFSGVIYWSAATYLQPPNALTYAWAVDYANGGTNASPKAVDLLVRVVRGAPF